MVVDGDGEAARIGDCGLNRGLMRCRRVGAEREKVGMAGIEDQSGQG